MPKPPYNKRLIIMEKKYKYKYWHIITKVNKTYQKENPEFKVGIGVGRHSKHSYGVAILDIKKGIEYNSAYTLDYVGRLLWDAPLKEVKELFDKNKLLTKQAKIL